MDERGVGDVGTVYPEAGGSGVEYGSTTGSESASGESGSTKEKVKEQAAASARDVAATTSNATAQVAGTAGEGARDVARETSRQVGQVAGEAAAQARQMLSQTTDQLKEQATAQTGRAAEGLRTVSSQLRALSEGRPEQAGAVGDYARQLTDKLGEFAGRLDEQGFEGMLQEAQRYARRRPGVFLLGAATAGFFAGRFLRGSQAAQSDDGGGAPYTSTMYDDAALSARLTPDPDEFVNTPPVETIAMSDAPLLEGGPETRVI